MDERERQRIEYTERNERNKVWHKKMQIYQGTVYGTLGVEFLLTMILMSTRAMGLLYVMGILFVAWFVWVLVGYVWVRCPHGDSPINNRASFINSCPYCGTKLGVYPDLKVTKTEENK